MPTKTTKKTPRMKRTTAVSSKRAPKPAERSPRKSGSEKVARPTPTPRKPGGLTAAATVLSGAKEPMHCQEIVDAAVKRGLWKSAGRTPAATIHAAMIREIAAKGAESRFKKVGRGLFVVTKKA